MRFVLDFSYATGLRASELVSAKLGQIERDQAELAWLRLRGKGNREGRVAIPALASQALDRHLLERKLPVSPSRWDSSTRLVGSLDAEAGITAGRLWAMVKRFFETAAKVVQEDNPILAEKLLRASPHWMRHTHATHLLDSGADLGRRAGQPEARFDHHDICLPPQRRCAPRQPGWRGVPAPSVIACVGLRPNEKQQGSLSSWTRQTGCPVGRQG
jgi:site-specific recombinase XerD